MIFSKTTLQEQDHGQQPNKQRRVFRLNRDMFGETPPLQVAVWETIKSNLRFGVVQKIIVTCARERDSWTA